MSIPIEPATVGISAVSGGAVILFLMKMAPILLRKMNGNSKGNNSSKPGEAKECIKRGKKMAEYDIVIKQLCTNMKEYKDDAKEARKEDREAAETARTENNDAHDKIFEKLDELRD